MTFEGRISEPKKGEEFWEIKVPDLGIFTQGKNERDAYAMTADAIKTVVEEKGFRVEIHPLGQGRFLVSGNNPTPLIARWLYRLRTKNHLTVREAAERLGAASPEAWARYESGRACPTIEKLTELVRAIDPETKFALKEFFVPSLKKVSQERMMPR